MTLSARGGGEGGTVGGRDTMRGMTICDPLVQFPVAQIKGRVRNGRCVEEFYRFSSKDLRRHSDRDLQRKRFTIFTKEEGFVLPLPPRADNHTHNRLPRPSSVF